MGMRFSGWLFFVSLLFIFSIGESKGDSKSVSAIIYEKAEVATVTTQEPSRNLPITIGQAKYHRDPFICGTRDRVKTASPVTDRLDLTAGLPSFPVFHLQAVYSSASVIYSFRESLFSFLQSLLYPKHSFW